MLFVFVFCLSTCTSALSIRVVEGGVPLVNPHEIIERGIRSGDASLLREAWLHYESSLKYSGVPTEGYLELGKIYFYLSLLGASTESDFDTAEFYARQAAASDPDNSDAHRALGLILAGRGAYLDAFEELTLAFYLNPTNELLIYDLASIHLALHQPIKSIEYLEGRNHKNGWAYVVLAMAWIQQGQKGKAILSLMKAKKLGYSDYWINSMLNQLSEELSLPLNR